MSSDLPDPRLSVARLLGAGLLGYGLLVGLGVIAHESLVAAGLSLGLGLLLLLLPTRTSTPSIHVQRWQPPAIRIAGAVLALGTLGHNVVQGSSLIAPEWGLVGYGALLGVASMHLDRTVGRVPVATLVAWSFPLLLAPLALFALDALISAGTGGQAAEPAINTFVVRPTAAVLGLLGVPVTVVGDNMHLATERGSLVLGVGLVCAGLYPMVLFLGMVAMQGWQHRVPAPRMSILVGVGLAALWALNVARLTILTQVGRSHGGAALQTVHAHIGWVLFALFMLVYWTGTRRWMGPGPAAAVPPAP